LESTRKGPRKPISANCSGTGPAIATVGRL
jgi:hypothetical protein